MGIVKAQSNYPRPACRSQEIWPLLEVTLLLSASLLIFKRRLQVRISLNFPGIYHGKSMRKKFSHSGLSVVRNLTLAKLKYVNLTQMNKLNLEDERA